jgi:large subunit ribosomal protein L29
MKRKAEEIRQFDIIEIKQKIDTLEKERYNLRYQSQTSKVEKPHRFKKLRKEIARCKTIIREKEISNAGK